jgi:hypothetical protein
MGREKQDEDMTLQEALERMAAGTLPEPPPLTAVEAVREILNRHNANMRGCKLHPGAKAQLDRVLAWLIQKEQQGRA